MTASKSKSRSVPTIPESERAKRGQGRVRLSAEALAAIDSAALPGEYRQDTACRLVIRGAEVSPPKKDQKACLQASNEQ